MITDCAHASKDGPFERRGGLFRPRALRLDHALSGAWEVRVCVIGRL